MPLPVPQSTMSLLRLGCDVDGHSRATGRTALMLAIGLWLCGPTALVFAQPAGGHGQATKPGGNVGAGARRSVNTKIADEAPPADVDRESLPPGFVPPREIPSFLKNCKEWTLNNNEKPDKKELARFAALKLANGVLSGKEDVDLLRKVIRFKLAEFTYNKKPFDNRERVFKLRDDLVRDVRNTVNQPVKDAMLDILVAEAPVLFDYCLEPRLNAVLMLAELSQKEVSTDGKVPAQPYFPACTPLLKLLNDPQQPDIVKIPAVIGVVRYAAPVPTNPDVKHKAVEALSSLLKNPKTYIWLQWRCAEGLGQIGYFKNLANQPVVLTLLREVMNDPKRDWEVRAQAARAIGRLSLEPTVDLKAASVDLASFALQMTVEYQKNPKQPHWQGCFFNLYLTFRPLDADEKRKGWGLLTLVAKPAFAAHSAIVNAVYQQCLPLIQNVLTPPAEITLPEAIKNLNDWLKTNAPNGGLNIAPAADPPKAKPPA